MVTIVGTDLDERLSGSQFKNYIDGAGGDDTISGGQLRDVLLGGDGDDSIYAGNGPDLVYGGAGDDFIFDKGSEPGAGVLHGGDGDDTIQTANYAGLGPFAVSATWWMFGDAGDDKLIAGSGGWANAYGGAGDDIIMMSSYGGGTAFGGAGNDRLFSERRYKINDEVDLGIGKYGPGANVTLHGGAGNDIMIGYSANKDTFVFNPGDGRDVIKNLGTGDRWVSDDIDLRGFGFEMTAEEVYETYAIERNNRIILDFGDEGTLVIKDTPYDGGTKILAEDVIDALLI